MNQSIALSYIWEYYDKDKRPTCNSKYPLRRMRFENRCKHQIPHNRVIAIFTDDYKWTDEISLSTFTIHKTCTTYQSIMHPFLHLLLTVINYSHANAAQSVLWGIVVSHLWSSEGQKLWRSWMPAERRPADRRHLCSTGTSFHNSWHAGHTFRSVRAVLAYCQVH